LRPRYSIAPTSCSFLIGIPRGSRAAGDRYLCARPIFRLVSLRLGPRGSAPVHAGHHLRLDRLGRIGRHLRRQRADFLCLRRQVPSLAVHSDPGVLAGQNFRQARLAGEAMLVQSPLFWSGHPALPKYSVLNGQHSQHFQWKHAISLDASGTVVGACSTPNRGGRMSYILAIMSVPLFVATGIYNPQVMHHGRCVADPGSYDALYCPAPAAPPHHPHVKR